MIFGRFSSFCQGCSHIQRPGEDAPTTASLYRLGFVDRGDLDGRWTMRMAPRGVLRRSTFMIFGHFLSFCQGCSHFQGPGEDAPTTASHYRLGFVDRGDLDGHWTTRMMRFVDEDSFFSVNFCPSVNHVVTISLLF